MNALNRFLACLLILTGINSYGQSYQFPVRPGDENWKQFQTPNEMYESCQIPSHILSKMSTQDLVETCINYPLINTLYAYNDLQKGFLSIKMRFNGFEELVKRQDSGNELMKFYDKMNPEGFDKNWSIEKIGKFTLEFTYVETLLAQRDIQSNMSKEERKKLVTICLNKYKAKLDHADLHGTYCTMNTVWVIGRLMENQDGVKNNTNSEYELARYVFIEQGLLTDLKVSDDIIEKAREYIK